MSVGDASRWYAVWTRSRHEQVVRTQLDEKQVTAFLPTMTRWSRWKDRKKQIDVPLFPGYVFVNFDVDQVGWRAINGTRGVRRLLTSERLTPLPMPDDAMASLIGKYDGRASAAGPDFQAGDSVLIVSGPFAEQYATVESLDDKGRVRLLFALLGGGARVSLDAGSIARLDE